MRLAEIKPPIAEAVNLVVHITRTPNGRQIKDILEVYGYKRGNFPTGVSFF